MGTALLQGGWSGGLLPFSRWPSRASTGLSHSTVRTLSSVQGRLSELFSIDFTVLDICGVLDQITASPAFVSLSQQICTLPYEILDHIPRRGCVRIFSLEMAPNKIGLVSMNLIDSFLNLGGGRHEFQNFHFEPLILCLSWFSWFSGLLVSMTVPTVSNCNLIRMDKKEGKQYFFKKVLSHSVLCLMIKYANVFCTNVSTGKLYELTVLARTC